MATGEDEAQLIVGDRLLLHIGRALVGGKRCDLLRVILERREARPAPDAVDRLEAAHGHEPRRRLLRHPLLRPLLESGAKGFVQGFLRDVEIAQMPDQGGEDLARFRAIDGIHRRAHAVGGILELGHGPR